MLNERDWWKNIYCFVVVLEMYLHRTDVQRGHSTSTQGKAPLVTVRYGTFNLWFRYVLICSLFLIYLFIFTYIVICSHNCHFQNKNWDPQKGKLSCFTWLTCCTVLVPESTPAPLAALFPRPDQFGGPGGLQAMSCRFLLWSSHWRPLPVSAGTTFPGGTPEVSDLSCRFRLRVRISRQGTTNGTLNCVVWTLFVSIKTAGNVCGRVQFFINPCIFFLSLSLAPRVSALAALFMPHVCNDSVGLASSPVRITLHVPTASRASIPPRAPSSVCSVLQVERYDLWDFHWCRVAQSVPWLWGGKIK